MVTRARAIGTYFRILTVQFHVTFSTAVAVPRARGGTCVVARGAVRYTAAAVQSAAYCRL